MYQFIDNTDGKRENTDNIIPLLLLILNSMTTKKSSAISEVTIVTNDGRTDGAKGAKVTTHEELWKGHANLPRTERGAIILTDELLRNLAASHFYYYKGKEFKILEKRSGTERGGKTLYKVKSGADIFTDFSIEELKQELGCEYRREKNGASNSKTPLGKAKYAVEKIAEAIEECKDEELKKAYQQLKGLVSLKRAEEQKREDAERAEREQREKEGRKVERVKNLFATLTAEQKAELLKSLQE